MVLFSNLVGLFLLIAVGFAAVRLKIVPAQMSKPLSALLMNITLPATVFISMIQPYDPGFLGLGLAAIVFSAVFFSLFSALSLPLSRLCRVPDGRRGMWCCCATYSNTGFMGFPVAYALFGADGLMLAVFFNIPFNFLLYTIGVRMVCIDAPKGDAKGSFSLRTALMTPLNAAIVLSLIFYFGQLPVPDALFTPLQHLSNVTTPLSMMVTGMNLAQGKVSDVIRDRDAITSSLTRLLVFPVICWVGMRLFPRWTPWWWASLWSCWPCPPPPPPPSSGSSSTAACSWGPGWSSCPACCASPPCPWSPCCCDATQVHPTQ